MKKEYIIPLVGLSEGECFFDYKLDNRFFLEWETLVDNDIKGELFVELTFLKKDNVKKIQVKIQGDLTTVCDRCLGTLTLPFCAENVFFVREREEGDEEQVDTVFIERDAVEIDLSQLFYEIIETELPQKKVHDVNKCNVDMLKKLNQVSSRTDEIDPRWKELEKLIKK